MVARGIRQKGWIWQNHQPTEIEYETGFAAEDGFPYCRMVSAPYLPLSPPPASSPQELVDARKRELRNTIEQYRQAIEALTYQLRVVEERYG